MDFYYAMTNYHLLTCMLHKLKFNNNAANLYISKYLLVTKPEIVDKIKKENIFNDVYIFEEYDFTQYTKKFNKKELDE